MLVQLVPNFSDQLVVCPYCPFNECHVTETLIPVTPRQLSGRQVHIIVAFSSFPHSVMCSRIPMEHKHHFLLSFSFFSKIRTDQAKSGNQEIRSKIRRFLINQDEMDTLLQTAVVKLFPNKSQGHRMKINPNNRLVTGCTKLNRTLHAESSK